ncbi:hypothetical protein AYI69_g4968 [Smittium culicis]|uniref:Uncharacterized protein n=1 Tax=Smittium culicis TaxID=133412 RepID=A0A1R1Y9Y7_9FUNG|nr:hypothetical protein AYI69_g4968 [Smittium culicis]
MNYDQLQVIDTETIIVKKTDSNLRGTQSALTQAIQPINYHIHRSTQEKNGIDTSKDPAILFASTMKEFF